MSGSVDSTELARLKQHAEELKQARIRIAEEEAAEMRRNGDTRPKQEPNFKVATKEEVAATMQKIERDNLEAERRNARNAEYQKSVRPLLDADEGADGVGRIAKKDKAAADAVRAVGVTKIDPATGVKITTYPPAPEPTKASIGIPDASDGFKTLAEDRQRVEARTAGRVGNSLKEPYNGGGNYKEHAPSLGGRGMKAVGPVAAAYEAAKLPMHVYEANKKLAEVSKEHNLDLSFGAKRSYEALYYSSKVADTASGGVAPGVAQAKLAEWGKENNVPMEALLKLQITQQKLNQEQMETLIYGTPLAKADVPAAGNKANAQAMADKLTRPSEVTRMAQADIDSVAPGHTQAAVPAP